MDKEAETQSRSRLTLDLSTRMTAALNSYADKHGISKAEVLRKAMELLVASESAVADGLKVGAWGTTDNHRVEREFVLL